MTVRTITVARGLTRLKTIKAQLENVASQIDRHGAINDKKRHQLGEKLDIRENHNKAKAEVQSLFQQHEALVNEFVKIKDAIDRSNLDTKITVKDKTLTVNQALIYQRHIEQHMAKLVQSNNRSVSRAEQDVEAYNRDTLAKVEDSVTRESLRAQVLYLVPQDKIKNINEFLIEFLTEINGTLNEVNATTMLTIEE